MPRPKKMDEAKRERRLTVYLTDQEKEVLEAAAERHNKPMTQIVTEAVHEWLMRLLDPPESLRKARYERIMNETAMPVRGFVCPKGHAWWIDWSEPMDPYRCPICGAERDIRRAWGGIIRRGL